MREGILVVSLTAACAALFFFGAGGYGLLDPNEPFYALSAKQMLERGDVSTPVLFGQAQFEKPPFFYWTLCASFAALGVNEAAARLAPAAAGVSIVLLTYLWGRLLFRRRAPALFGAAVLATAGLFIAHSRIVLPDIYLCLFATAALTAYTYGEKRPAARNLAWTACFLAAGFGFLVKGPLGAVMPLSAIASYRAFGRREGSVPWAGGMAVFAAITLPWVGLMTMRYGGAFLSDFFIHENLRRVFVAEHARLDHPLFYPAVILAGFFPWSTFLPGVVASSIRRRTLLFFAAASPLVFLTFAKSKLPSYELPLLPPLALAVGQRLWALERLGVRGGAALRAWTCIAWIAVPAVAAFGAHSYIRKHFASADGSLWWTAALGLPFFVAASAFLWKGRCRAAWVSAAGGAFAVTLGVFCLLLPAASEAFSSQRLASEYLALDPRRASPVFATKRVFRGVSLYTGISDPAVFAAEGERAFYTPPPLRFYTRPEDTIPGDGQRVSYGFVRDKDVEPLRDSVRGRAVVEVLSRSGRQNLIRVERAGA